MRVAIIGATGFIGRELANYLKSNGDSVTVLTRHLGHARNILGKDYQYALWDGQSVTALNLLVASHDAIINLAGENISNGRWSNKRKLLLYNSRITPAKALMEAIQNSHKKPSVVMQISASGIYGNDYDGTPGSEKSEGFLSVLCNDWEEAVKPLDDSPTRLVIMRMAVVLGKNEGMLSKLTPAFKAFLGGHTGSGKQWLPWIHKYDVASAIYHLLHNEKARGTFDFAAPESVTQKTFCHSLGMVLDRPSWFHIPPFMIRILFGEMGKETLLSSQKIYPQKLLDTGYSFHYPKLEDALKEIYK